jgi:transcriptional regulator with XRE-family HTH domain
MKKSIGRPEQDALQRVLTECRVAAGLTQRQLAKRLGTFQSRIYDYESGERRLDLVQLRDYVAAMGLTLAEFVARFEAAIAEGVEAGQGSPMI